MRRAWLTLISCVSKATYGVLSQTTSYDAGMEECANDDPKLERLQRRAAELLARFYPSWTPLVLHSGSGAGIRWGGLRHDNAGIVELMGIGFIEAIFVRGFVEEVEATAESWLERGDAIVEAAPIRLVRLTTRFKPRYGMFADGKYIAAFPDGSNEIVRSDGFPGTQEEVCRSLCEHRWPGIRFEFPISRNVSLVRTGMFAINT